MKKKVLVVEDDKTTLTLLKQEFKKYDYIEAFYAETYKDAMRLIRGHKGNFHTALLDLNLPDAHDGEIVKLVNSHHISAIILTATLDQKLKDLVLKKDVVDFVLKSDPSSIEFAVNYIARILKNYETTVLVVDDSPMFRELVTNNLKQIHLNIIEANDGQEALNTIEKNKDISLVITDYEMPNVNGLELTLQIRAKYKKDEIAIIAMSSVDKKEVISNFLKFGANDFLNKPFSNDELFTRINSNLELLDLFSQVKDMANKDFLTGAYNRRYFFNSGGQIFSKAKRKELPLAVAMIDIDKFKNINDTYGHDIGDVAIQEIKTILDTQLRGSDLMARFGGEEFCIVLEDITLENTQLLFEKIRQAFEDNIIKIKGLEISYTVSIGIFYGMSSSLEEMVKLSDDSLYIAKNNGRNRIIINEII